MSGKGRRRGLSEQAKVSAFRWWFAGAMYFLIAWGTPLGRAENPLDLIFVLGAGIGAGTLFVFDPIVRGMFDTRRRGGNVNCGQGKRSVPAGAIRKLLELLKCLFVTFLTFLSYQAVNLAAVRLFALSADAVVLRGEPILFASFFLLYYNSLTHLAQKVRSAALSIREGTALPESGGTGCGKELQHGQTRPGG